jgi:hypothetical protein
MGVRRIPLDPYPNTTQQSELDGVTYSFRFRWSQRGNCWHMDLRTLDGLPVLLSVRLVSGFPLLRRLVRESRPSGELYMVDLTGRGEDPTLEEFGARFGLFYVEGSGR